MQFTGIAAAEALVYAPQSAYAAAGNRSGRHISGLRAPGAVNPLAWCKQPPHRHQAAIARAMAAASPRSAAAGGASLFSSLGRNERPLSASARAKAPQTDVDSFVQQVLRAQAGQTAALPMSLRKARPVSAAERETEAGVWTPRGSGRHDERKISTPRALDGAPPHRVTSRYQTFTTSQQVHSSPAYLCQRQPGEPPSARAPRPPASAGVAQWETHDTRRREIEVPTGLMSVAKPQAQRTAEQDFMGMLRKDTSKKRPSGFQPWRKN